MRQLYTSSVQYSLFFILMLALGMMSYLPSQAQTVRRWDWGQSSGSQSATNHQAICQSPPSSLYSGTIYAGGLCDASGTIKFDGVTYPGQSKGTVVSTISTYSSTGTPLDLWSFGQGGFSSVLELQVDASGYIYVLGRLMGTCTFGTYTCTTPSNTEQTYVAKLAPWGSVMWVSTIGLETQYLSFSRNSQRLLKGANGKIYLKHFVTPGTYTVGNYSLTAPTVANANGPTATIFTQYDANTGNLDWASKLDDGNAKMVCDNTGNLFVAGLYTAIGTPPSDDIEIRKIGISGVILASQRLYSNSCCSSFGSSNVLLGTDSGGNVYLSSSFNFMLTVGAYSLTTNGRTNSFLLKVNNDLAPQWLKNTFETQPNDLVVATSGSVFVLGEHQQTVTLGAITLPFTPSPMGYTRNVYALSANTNTGAFTAGAVVTPAGTYGLSPRAIVDLNGNLNVAWNLVGANYQSNQQLTSLTPALGTRWQVQLPFNLNGACPSTYGGVLACGYKFNRPNYTGLLGLVTDISATNGSKTWEKVISTGAPTISKSIAVGSARDVYTATSAKGIYDDDGIISQNEIEIPSRARFRALSATSNPAYYRVLSLRSLYQDAQAVSIAYTGTNYITATGHFTGPSSLRDESLTPVMALSSTTTGTSGELPDAFVVRYDTAFTPQWIRQFGGVETDKGSGVDVDVAGNTYAVGTFSGNGTFVSATLTSAGGLDGYLVKLDPAGTVLWAVRYGGSGSDEPLAIALGSGGEVYVTGRFTGVARFGALPALTSGGGYDAFLARFDPATGNALWAQKAGATGADAGTAVKVNASGSIIWAGSFEGAMLLGTNLLTSSGGTDGFVISCANTGGIQWAQHYGGTGNDAVNGLVVSASAGVHITGQFQGTVTMGSSSLTSAGGTDAFISQLAAGTGVAEQAWRLGGPGDDVANGIDADANGNLYICGAFADSVDVGSTRLRSKSYAQNAFYARLAIPHVWTGLVSRSWTNAGNWSDNAVPTAADDVTLPSGAVRYPLLQSGTIQMKGLTLASGADVAISGGTMEVAGSFSTTGGTVTQTGGLVRLTGTSLQTVGGSASLVFGDVEVGPAGANLSGPVEIERKLTLNGSLVSTGNLTLRSSALGTALVVNNGTAVVTGSVTVQRYIEPSLNPGRGYRHYSSPVVGNTLGDLATPGFAPVFNPTYNSSAAPLTVTPFPTVYGYDQSRVATTNNNLSAFDKGWFSPVDASSQASAMVPGVGYSVHLPASETVDFVGTLNTGNYSVPLVRGNSSEAGWQLVGNPYPAPLDYSLVAPADRLNLNAGMYVAESTGPYAGQYRSYVNGVGNPVLPLGQGFFVRVSAGQTSGTLTFRNDQRLTTPNPTAFLRGTANLRPLVQLELRGSTGPTDAFYTYAQPGATPDFDAQYDAQKLPNTSGLNLTSRAATGQALAIDGRPAFAATTVLALSVGVPAAGAYSLSAAAINNLPTGLEVFLTDAATGQTVNLSQQPSYSFSVSPAQAATLMTGRFTLFFKAQSVLATAPELTAATVTLYPNPAHRSFTLGLPALADQREVRATLVNALGQNVATRTISLSAAGTTTEFQTELLTPGVYTLRLQAAAQVLTKRVVIE